MKRQQHSNKGSAVGSGTRQGRVKFGTGKTIVLRNGILFSPTSSQVNIDSNTGEIYVYCNVYVKAPPVGDRDYVSEEYTALTPEEVSELFDYYSDMTFEEAYNILYDTNPKFFSEYTTKF